MWKQFATALASARVRVRARSDVQTCLLRNMVHFFRHWLLYTFLIEKPIIDSVVVIYSVRMKLMKEFGSA